MIDVSSINRPDTLTHDGAPLSIKKRPCYLGADHTFVTDCLIKDVTESLSRASLDPAVDRRAEVHSDAEGGRRRGLRSSRSAALRGYSGAHALGVILHLADQPLNSVSTPGLQATAQSTQMDVAPHRIPGALSWNQVSAPVTSELRQLPYPVTFLMRQCEQCG